MLDLKKYSRKGNIHFSAIGGIGMSGVASLLYEMGCNVQGSDISTNQNTKRLQKMGVTVFQGHDSKNLKGISLCVRSSIIKDDNVEIEYCRKHNIPVVHRSDVLIELLRGKKSIAVSGTHGKTTTTSMIASVLEEARKSPTVINGGIINTKNTNAYFGKGEYVIAEADESDKTFVKLPSTISIITNIDSEHLDFYGSYENIKNAFFQFIDQLPEGGFGVVCTDNSEVKKLLFSWAEKDIITYGFNDTPDVKAINIKPSGVGYSFDVVFSKKFASRKEIKGVSTNIPGAHNVKNSLAAIAVALKLSIEDKDIISGVAKYTGVKRRFTVTGEKNGVIFVDDYAHHPEEIIATLNAAKNVVSSTGGRVITVFQPHKYTRLRDLFERFVNCFVDSDILYIADVYAASEEPINGINSAALVKSIRDAGKCRIVYTLESSGLLPEILRKNCQRNDIVMFLGAGDITKWAYEIPSKVYA